MKYVLLVIIPAAFVSGVLVGRRSVSPPAEFAKPTPAPASLPVVEPLAAMMRAKDDNGDDVLAQQALEAYVKGQYALSVKLANQALEIDDQQPLALRILGAVDCKLKNREGAKAVIAKAPPQFRPFIKMVCHSEGIEIP